MKFAIGIATLLAAGFTLHAAASASDEQAGSRAVQAAPAPTASAKDQFKINRVTPSYWRVVIEHPPFNIFGPESMPMLNNVITQIERDPQLKVVVFESAVPGFFLTHYDFVPPLELTTSMPNGPTGLPPLPDMLVRLSKSPVVSIVKIRGRATGVGSELALAADMRFASREKAVLSQFEIGAGFVPGGGPMARLPRLMGRGRALEILLSGKDINGELAERYGYVNRSLPDVELDRFVDDLARRIASYDKQSLGEIKNLVNVASLPPDKDVGAEWPAFISSVQRPAAQRNIKRLMELGLQKNPDVETHLDKYTGQVNQPAK
ncbi:enoyl-CoA hydratase/isomerase family protein [Telluria aromaticivorans]|uniref:Enoyl-CoA hydratase/isomerase family protein n=1 Tax=Telluria aromaticivorans TaxID=2725995 RepID=A0A7Y2JUY2_9BURK|nr:enoyl-CoA hydratase/isomerase family protein [Telluria aromaticivorans]NNG21441.1 enoyl-CoA hydratase/isomerase family protein [Telluria aromaticivorans]